MPMASAAISISNWRAEGPEFDKKVWEALIDIPFGTTTSYGAIAKKHRPSRARPARSAPPMAPIPSP